MSCCSVATGAFETGESSVESSVDRELHGRRRTRAMSKRETNAPGWTNSAPAPQSHMATDPAVGRFSDDQTVSMLAKGPSAKFNDHDRTKSLAPFSNHGQLSQEPSQQRPAGTTDIVDLRTPAPESEWKRYGLY